MSATLQLPSECCTQTDQLDTLLDITHDLGGVTVEWGAIPARQHVIAVERVFVTVAGLPGHKEPLKRTGSTLNMCALAILHSEWPDPADQPGDEAG